MQQVIKATSPCNPKLVKKEPERRNTSSHKGRQIQSQSLNTSQELEEGHHKLYFNSPMPTTLSLEQYQPKPGCAQDILPLHFLCQPYTLDYAFVKIHEWASWCVLAPNWGDIYPHTTLKSFEQRSTVFCSIYLPMSALYNRKCQQLNRLISLCIGCCTR